MENTLLNARAILPTYDRDALAARIVHLGFGAFHRAHQAVYADILAAEHGSDWGYCEINLIGGEQQIADIRRQDNLYTVAEMSADAWRARVVGVVKARCTRRWMAPRPYCRALPAAGGDSHRVTITEKGYCHSPATGELVMDNRLSPPISRIRSSPRRRWGDCRGAGAP